MNWHRALPQTMQMALKSGYEDYHLRLRQRRSEQQIAHEAWRISEVCLGDVSSLDAWECRRRSLKLKISWMFGLEPSPERPKLEATIVGVLDRPRYIVEKVVLQSRPGLFVPANFYLPKDGSRQFPCVIYLSGHWPSLHGAKTGYQDRYLWYPNHGFACLVIDPLEFGEVPGIHHGTSNLNYWHWFSLGYTPAGVEIWNAMRAIDWLETRPEVDIKRIGVTGISGGGVMTQYLAALDDRVAVAAPSCSTYTIGTQASMGLVPQQCDCTYYPNVYGVDFPAVLALIAPRPLIIFGGRADPIFPPAGFRAAYKRAKKVYDLYGETPDGTPRIRLVESSEGHTDPPAFLRECHLWMQKHLQPDALSSVESAGDTEYPIEAPDVLTCIRTTPSSAANYNIHNTWIRPAAPAIPGSAKEWDKRRQELMTVLREKVFGWFPEGIIPFRTRRLKNSGGYAGEFTDFGEYEFDSEARVPISACVLKPRVKAAESRLLVWVKRSCDHVNFPDIDELMPLISTTPLLILTPRFTDRALSGGEFARIERTAALNGRTIAAMGVWDVMRAVVWASSEMRLGVDDVTVYGRGESGVIAIYAALFESRIGHIVAGDLPTSHRNGPALLTVLRHTDITEVAAALAPRRLTFIVPHDPAFELTRRVYAVIGAEGFFLTKGSVVEAVMNTRPAESSGAQIL